MVHALNHVVEELGSILGLLRILNPVGALHVMEVLLSRTVATNRNVQVNPFVILILSEFLSDLFSMVIITWH